MEIKFTIQQFTNLVAIILSTFLIGSCNNQPSTKTTQTESDSLSYETITLINSYQNCEPNTKSCTYISLEYPQFTNVQKPLFDSLSNHINHFIGASPENKITEPSDLIETFIQRYASLVEQDSTYKTPWTLERTATVYHQNSKQITLQLSEYSYEGGAHPNSAIQYLLVSKLTGKQLYVNDFFDTLSIAKLTMLAEPIFCTLKGISQSHSMAEAGFDFANNKFALNTNFYFNDAGITFYYNTYEIGPYALGPTILTIPKYQVVKLMKK